MFLTAFPARLPRPRPAPPPRACGALPPAGPFFLLRHTLPLPQFFLLHALFSQGPAFGGGADCPAFGGAGPLPRAARRPLFSPLPFGKAKPAPAFGPSKAPTTPPRCKKPLEIPFLSHRALRGFLLRSTKKRGPRCAWCAPGPPFPPPCVSSSLFQRGERQGGGFGPAQPFRLPQRPLIFEKPEFPGGLAGDAAQAAGHPAAEIE